MNTQAWWGAERPPRDYAAAIMAMDCKVKRKEFFDTVVPDHLKEIVRDHCVTAQRMNNVDAR